MVTLNQVIKNLSSIASAHYQIKSFGNGSIQEFATSGVTNYPAMWVDYESSRVEGRAYVHVVRVYVADRLIKGKKNELDVLSDVQQVCLDIIAQAQNSAIYGWKLISDSVTLTLFSEPRFDDEDAGYYFDLVLKVPFDYDRCQIPFSAAITNGSQYPSGGSTSGTINVYIDGVLVSSTNSNDLNAEIVNITWT